MPGAIHKKAKYFYGVGINDADYAVRPKINGKVVSCPFYVAWVNMLKRCYCPKYQQTHKTYIGCSIAFEWRLFSNFKSWMTDQDWKGKSLDKDILNQHNKIYSSLTCIFVNKHINAILTDHAIKRGNHPLGVTFVKSIGKYRAQCNTYSKHNNIGYYTSSEEAYEAYKKFKYKYIAEVANQQSEPLRTALLNYVIEG
jgi:hypothetical protein